jgi:hypothetical protein
VRPPTIPGMPGMVGSHENWGNFKCHKWGEYGRHSQGRTARRPSFSWRMLRRWPRTKAPCTTKLYDRTGDEDEVERIAI